MSLSVEDYTVKTWEEKFPDYEVDLSSLPMGTTYDEIIDDLREKESENFKKLEKKLSDNLKEIADKDNKYIFPYPDLIFNWTRYAPLDDIKVIILGQDPYFESIQANGKIIPQAMGLSFSVPKGISVPSSLKNIYKNQLDNKEIFKNPTHGNLDFWAYQGCLMLNSALTVESNAAGTHLRYWSWFTDSIIKYISKNTENKIFVLWGGPSLKKNNLIDMDKHETIISSHPSGLSCDKPLQEYPSFKKNNHFGKINKYLIKSGQDPILWQIT